MVFGLIHIFYIFSFGCLHIFSIKLEQKELAVPSWLTKSVSQTTKGKLRLPKSCNASFGI